MTPSKYQLVLLVTQQGVYFHSGLDCYGQYAFSALLLSLFACTTEWKRYVMMGTSTKSDLLEADSISLNSVTGTIDIFLFFLNHDSLGMRNNEFSKGNSLPAENQGTFFPHVSNGPNRTQLPWNKMPLRCSKTVKFPVFHLIRGSMQILFLGFHLN